MTKEKVYQRPIVLIHQPIHFETAQSWNPGNGNHDHKGKGNDGIQFPVDSNTNTQPCGAGEQGGIGQCNPQTNPKK
ncbi:hypothetical protein J7E81_18025 [Bacillus sp. ISL-18]|uniref:hypothetical protein n=1 Tax=Bacillus sp. ISL-18 TaxID=2819118 RepID=UPI001BE9D5AB|nr:hypothetical protein [Bacillus sp. ISL-18]MBT2657100.1 hypothetical protein [Bacillus sp. ISL-18]